MELELLGYNKNSFMRYLVTVTFLFFFIKSYNQEDYTKIIEPNIFRAYIAAPVNLLGVHYEHKLKQNISIAGKVGLNFAIGISSTLSEGRVRIQTSLLSSVEARYYFNIKRRDERNKTIQNFSGWYLGLEPFVRTHSLFAINEVKKNNNGLTGVFVNLGFQKQPPNRKIYGGFYIGYSPISNSMSGTLNSSEINRVWLNFLFGFVL